MELWVIAEVLGLHVQTENGAPTPEQFSVSSADLLARRVRAAQTGEKVTAPAGGATGGALMPGMVEEALARKRRREEAAG